MKGAARELNTEDLQIGAAGQGAADDCALLVIASPIARRPIPIDRYELNTGDLQLHLAGDRAARVVNHCPLHVMAGLVPAIHVFAAGQ